MGMKTSSAGVYVKNRSHLDLLKPATLLLLAFSWWLWMGVAPVTASPWVKISNEMGPGKTITVNCWYGKRQEPLRRLAPEGGEYFFDFNQNFLETVVWSCNFYDDRTSRRQTFVVWDRTPRSVMPSDCHQCLWVVHQDGFYVWDKFLPGFKFYVGWNNN